MDTQIAVFDTHEKALHAISVLNDYHFPMAHVTLLGKADVIDNHIHVRSLTPIKNAPALLGMGAGTLIGLLSGLGVFAIPGFGFIYGAGALIGAIAGFDIGIVGGGIVSLLAILGIRKDKQIICKEHLEEGKFMVIVHGTPEEVAKGENILHTHGTHLEFVH